MQHPRGKPGAWGRLDHQGCWRSHLQNLNVLVTAVCSPGPALACGAGVRSRPCSCVATWSDAESAVLWGSLAELTTVVPLSPGDMLQDPPQLTFAGVSEGGSLASRRPQKAKPRWGLLCLIEEIRGDTE